MLENQFEHRKSNVLGSGSKGGTTPTHSSSSAVPSKKAKKNIKYHYPTIALNDSSIDYGDSHSEKFRTLVTEVCDNELDGLLDFLGKDRLMGKSEKQSVVDAITGVLSHTPKASCVGLNNNTTFLPEITREEVTELKALIREKQKLQMFSDLLETYTHSVEKLATAQELWLGSVPQNSNKSSGANDSLAETAAYYGELLDSMDAHCDLMLQSLTGSEALLEQGRKLQDELFDKFNKARNEAAVATTASSSAPKDTRDTLRIMPSLL